jgi:hypothetical protein
MQKIIMIAGGMGVGKTKLADGLEDALTRDGAWVYRTRFSKAVYQCHDLITKHLRACGLTMKAKDRDLLRMIGSDWGRNCISSDIWVKTLLSDISHREVRGKANFIIIDDLRFENEFNMKVDGVKIIKIRLTSSEECRKARCSAWSDQPHDSEGGLDSIDDSKFHMVIDAETNSASQVLAHVLAYVR